jgi:hypothetical protein
MLCAAFSRYDRVVPEVCEKLCYGPITDLLKLVPGQIFFWTNATNSAFLEIKSELLSTPILQLPYYSQQFNI